MPELMIKPILVRKDEYGDKFEERRVRIYKESLLHTMKDKIPDLEKEV